MAFRKTYVEVTARIEFDGRLTPLEIVWRDGRIFAHRPRARAHSTPLSQRVGGTGIRYLVSVNGREKYLFYEGPRWFVEEVAPDEPRPSS